jgi:hypothetical protein
LTHYNALLLRSFSSSLLKATDMLSALQVQHLTHVKLSSSDKAVIDSSALSMALARLSNLKQLHTGDMSDASLGAALTTLVQLFQLTLLECDSMWPLDWQDDLEEPTYVLATHVSLALQQLLAQPLPLRSLQLPYWGRYQLPVLNMALLTKLTELSTGNGGLAEATVLPTQLQWLQIHSSAGGHSIAPLTRLDLKQLQHLSVRGDVKQPQLLQRLQLAQLPALTHLALQYDAEYHRHTAAATASAWPLLPQLRELEIVHDWRPPSQSQWEAILAGAAAAACLTKLTLDARMVSGELQEEEEASFNSDNDVGERWASEVAACASLAKLTCLQDLTIGGGDVWEYDFWKLNLVRGDALALTALTRLTHLGLSFAQHGVGTAVATALACSLQQLQSLHLIDCCLQLGSAEGLACLEAIGRLTQLTCLSLGGNEGLTPQGLMQLTRLCRLEQAAGG